MTRLVIASEADLGFLLDHESHIGPEELSSVVSRGRVLLAVDAPEDRIGWLRWGLFWDEVPFMNLLYVLEGARGRGVGRRLVRGWETLMREHGHALLLTSTLSTEPAQHFYRRLGYTDYGGFSLPGEPEELILGKRCPPVFSRRRR